jgi:hypothetical protein
LHHGHAVTLYSYQKIAVPKGVLVEDAALIMSEDKIYKDKKHHSITAFSNFFRIMMMKNTDNIWLDADILLINPLHFDDPYVFEGYINVDDQNQIWANNSILYMKSKSPVIDGVLEYMENPQLVLPLIHSKTKRIKLAMKNKISGKWDLGGFPWGAFGTYILTDVLRKNDLTKYILLEDDRYYGGRQELFEPIENLHEVTQKAVFAHFSTSRIVSGKIRMKDPVEGSLYKWAIDRYIS